MQVRISSARTPKTRHSWPPWAVSVTLALAIVAFLAGPAGGASRSDVQTSVPVPSHGAYLGILSDLPGKTHAESVATREAQFGRTFDIDSHYYDWVDPFPTEQESDDVAAGRIPMVTWWGTQYAQINDGSQDALIRARAEDVKAFGHPIFIRWAAEMNGYWFAWGGAQNGDDPSGFVAAWRRIHDIFAAEGVTNVSWVWAPNSESNPAGTGATSWNDWRNYYPGDAYVDWVGIDGYNWGDYFHGIDEWQSLGSIMSPIYDAYAAEKPIMIAETSSVESGGSKSQWIGDAATWIEAHPAVKAVVFFDHSYPDKDWAIDSSQASADAFSDLARNPYFNPSHGSAPPSPPTAGGGGTPGGSTNLTTQPAQPTAPVTHPSNSESQADPAPKVVKPKINQPAQRHVLDRHSSKCTARTSPNGKSQTKKLKPKKAKTKGAANRHQAAKAKKRAHGARAADRAKVKKCGG